VEFKFGEFPVDQHQTGDWRERKSIRANVPLYGRMISESELSRSGNLRQTKVWSENPRETCGGPSSNCARLLGDGTVLGKYRAEMRVGIVPIAHSGLTNRGDWPNPEGGEKTHLQRRALAISPLHEVLTCMKS